MLQDWWRIVWVHLWTVVVIVCGWCCQHGIFFVFIRVASNMHVAQGVWPNGSSSSPIAYGSRYVCPHGLKLSVHQWLKVLRRFHVPAAGLAFLQMSLTISPAALCDSVL